MNCYACMLGDDDRRTLYLVTAVDSDATKARATPQRRDREGTDDGPRRRPPVMPGGRRPRGGAATGRTAGRGGRAGRGARPGSGLGGSLPWSRRGRPHRRLVRTAGGRDGGTPVPPGPGRLGLGRVPAHGRPSTRSAHELGLRRRPRAAGTAALARADRRAPRLPGRHHGHHARRRWALPLPGGDAAEHGRGVPPGPSLDGARHRRPRVQRPAAPACGTRSSTRPAWTERSPPSTTSSGQILAAAQGSRAAGRDSSSGSATTTPIWVTIVRGPAGQAFAAASLGVMERLDDTLRAVLPGGRRAHGRRRLGLRPAGPPAGDVVRARHGADRRGARPAR